jgi:hypothetical protein
MNGLRIRNAAPVKIIKNMPYATAFSSKSDTHPIAGKGQKGIKKIV